MSRRNQIKIHIFDRDANEYGGAVYFCIYFGEERVNIKEGECSLPPEEFEAFCKKLKVEAVPMR